MARVHTFWADLVRLYRGHYWLAVAMWVPGLAMALVQRPDLMLESVISSCVLTLMYQATLSAYGLHLEHRIDSGNDEFLHVRIDGIDAGALSANEYAAMRHRATFSLSTYLRQVCNIGMMAVNFCRWMVRYVPVLMFWTMVCGLLVDAAGMVKVIQAILFAAQRDPEQLAAFLAKFLGITMFWSAGLCAFVAGRRLGFRNECREAWQHMLRSRLNLPSSGELTLYRMRGNHAMPVRDGADFRAYLRKRYRFGVESKRALSEAAQ